MKKQNWSVLLAMVALAFMLAQGCASRPQTLYQRIIEVPTGDKVDADKTQTVYQTFVPSQTSVVAKDVAAPVASAAKTAVAAAPTGGISVPIQDGVEIVEASDAKKLANTVAKQTVWDPNKFWRRQIILINGADESLVTEQMRKLAENNIPTRNGIRDWESWKFAILYPNPTPKTAEELHGIGKSKTSAEKPAVKAEAQPALVVEKTAKIETAVTPPVAAKPAPAVDANAELAAMRTKLAELLAADAERQKAFEKAEKAQAKTDKKARTAAAAKALKDQYIKKLAKLGYEGSDAVPNFQGAVGITKDGVLGPQTRRMIDKAMATLEDCLAKQLGDKACEDARKAAIAAASNAPAPAPATK